MAKTKQLVRAQEPLFDGYGQRTHERYVSLYSENDTEYVVEEGNERGAYNYYTFGFSGDGLEGAVMKFDSLNRWEVAMSDWDRLEDEREMWRNETVRED